MKTRLTLMLIAVSGLFAGCGSGDGHGSTSGTATGGGGTSGIPGPNRAAYIKRGNAACLRARRQAGSILTTARAELSALGSLGPAPEGDSGALEAVLAILRRNLHEAQARSKDPSEKTEDYFLAADQRLIGFGFVDCIV